MEHLRKAHYELDEIKKLLERGARVINQSAFKTAVSLGYASEEEIVARVKKLKYSEIYKTMTSHFKHKIWHDVYKTADVDVKLYIKLQISEDGKGVVISFKEAESW